MNGHGPVKVIPDRVRRADTCPWREAETLFVGSIKFRLLRNAVRAQMSGGSLLKQLLTAPDREAPFWVHLYRYESTSCREFMAELIEMRMPRICYGYGSLLDAAMNPGLQEAFHHLKDCHECRSELGSIKADLPNREEFIMVRTHN